MKTITLKETFEILQNADAVVIDSSVLSFLSLKDLIEEASNPFLHLRWELGGEVFKSTFLEIDNQEVKISGPSMFLIDDEGHEVRISILHYADLEE